MIPTLYKVFQKWSETGSIYLISDTHFDDRKCSVMDPDWISPQEHIDIIKKKVHKSDTLIHLGDVGNIDYLINAYKKGKKPYAVLITGNHDDSIVGYDKFFDEIYTGPLFISDKLVLSHEPITGIPWCLNIHGHDHYSYMFPDPHHIDIASNVVRYKPVNLKDVIDDGYLKRQKGIHRVVIDQAIKNKAKRQSKVRSV